VAESSLVGGHQQAECPPLFDHWLTIREAKAPRDKNKKPKVVTRQTLIATATHSVVIPLAGRNT